MTRRYPLRRWSKGWARSGLPVYELDLDWVPADLWIGVFVKPIASAYVFYICPLPTISFRLSIMRKSYR